MSNERLGIYEELRARAETYSEYSRLRRRLADPVITLTGAKPQPVNPFIRVMRYRFQKVGAPANQRRFRGTERARPLWPEAKFGISIDLVIKTVVDESEIRADEMFSIHQTHRITRPRQVAMYMVDRYCPDYSLPQIGLIFGRDHTTVVHAIEAVTVRLLDKDPVTVDLVARTHERLREIAG